MALQAFINQHRAGLTAASPGFAEALHRRLGNIESCDLKPFLLPDFASSPCP
jgi:hypothetical protein